MEVAKSGFARVGLTRVWQFGIGLFTFVGLSFSPIIAENAFAEMTDKQTKSLTRQAKMVKRQLTAALQRYNRLVKKGHEERVGEIARAAIRKAGETLGFRCPHDGDYKHGADWAATH